MKTKKALRKLKALLSADERAQLAKYDSLEKVLRKLESKEATLREKLEGESDEERRREILRKLDVINAQHQKGAKLKEDIKKLRDAEPTP
jgi:hypothetical protein